AGLIAAARRGSPAASAHHGSLGPGDACYDSRQCVAADAPLVCADNGYEWDGPLNCCTYVGSRCSSDEGCCGDASCLDGFCSLALVIDYVGAGEVCYDGSQCVAADTSLSCDYVSNTNDYRCCAYEGSRCGNNRSCCGSASCVDGFCAAAPLYSGPGDPCQNSSQCLAADTSLYCDYVANTDDYRCCTLDGGRCSTNRGCCGWLSCNNGFCG
ncbi:MAG: hypothetical protein M3464_16985, partial [Chloroflexota bacterium]|nr:hypothetical protein [Chloroflexota bacterium]